MDFMYLMWISKTNYRIQVRIKLRRSEGRIFLYRFTYIHTYICVRGYVCTHVCSFNVICIVRTGIANFKFSSGVGFFFTNHFFLSILLDWLTSRSFPSHFLFLHTYACLKQCLVERVSMLKHTLTPEPVTSKWFF
jgi:hypothetical protein